MLETPYNDRRAAEVIIWCRKHVIGQLYEPHALSNIVPDYMIPTKLLKIFGVKYLINLKRNSAQCADPRIRSSAFHEIYSKLLRNS